MAGPSTGGWCRRDGDDLLLEVRLQPRARREGLSGVRAGRLLVRVTAPPIEGRANRALAQVLAAACGVPPSRVSVVRGAGGRDKTVRVARPRRLPRPEADTGEA